MPPPEDLHPSDLVRIEADALERLAGALDGGMQAPFNAAVDLLVRAVTEKRNLVVTGVGKSGIIGQKVAATLRSTGTPAHFLHASEAVHGDLGMLCGSDVVLALSASGETAEMLSLLPALKRLSATVIAFCGCPESTLARAADILLDTSVSAEACPHNLAPTASTTVMLALGDALALTVSYRLGFGPQEFADLHPGGRLGRRLTRVRDVMHTGQAIPCVSPETSLPEVIHEMSRKRLGMTTVLEAGRLVGIIADGDLRRLLEREAEAALTRTAGEIMNREPVTIEETAFGSSALTLMESRKITSLIVTSEGGAVGGVLHLHDLWENRPS